ncbi:hypothetical protein NFI96_004023 [Prochilodus magdalenae]|nr:hypothetical protein NFI96_004023 [Prochilodus magdalenae]
MVCFTSLYRCSITKEGCAALVSALKSNPSHVRELNLSANKPGESGVKLLYDLLEDPYCKLEKLHLSDCRITEEGCAALVSALKSNPSHLRELNLSWNKPGESGVKLLSDLLEDPHCKLEKLQLYGCNLTERSCAVLSPALSSSSLRELNLGNNELQDRGVKLLSAGLKNPHCKLEKLDLAGSPLNEGSATGVFPGTMAALTSTLYKSLTRRHLVKVACRVSVEEYCLAAGSVVSASRMDNAVALFLNTVEKANGLVQTGIVLQDQLTPVHPLSTPATKVILSNIPQFIKDEHLARELSRFWKLVFPIRKIPLVVNPPGQTPGGWSTWF